MRFLSRFLASLAALSVLYAIGVSIVDPRANFGTGIFPTVVVDDRADKLALASRYPGGIDGLILGSSRSQKLDPAILQAAVGGRFFNFAVSAAEVEDDLAAYRWVREHGQHPKTVVIGLDVNALADTDVAPPAIEKSPTLEAALGGSWPAEGTGTRLRRIARTFETAFTLDYLDDMYHSARTYARRLIIGRKAGDELFRADGYDPGDFYPRRPDGTIDDTAHFPRCIADYVKIFGHMKTLGDLRKQYLETLVGEARRDGATVKLWITPVHPLGAEALARETQYPALLTQTRAFLAELRDRYGVETYDFSDPRSYGGTLSGWYDCVHVNPADNALIESALLKPGS
jgi:hypothetical protein